MHTLSLFLATTLTALTASCTTESSAAVGPDGGSLMTDSTRTDAETPSSSLDTGGVADDASSVACTNGPTLTLTNGVLKDAAAGFEFPLPMGFAIKPRNCGLYPVLEEIAPASSGPMKRVELRVTKQAFSASASDKALRNPGGVTYYLVAGYGQETGKISEWNVIVPAATWFLTISTPEGGKATLEAIAAAFRWTR
jgi:hypothetical protein